MLEEKQKELISLANKGKDYESIADEIDNLRKNVRLFSWLVRKLQIVTVYDDHFVIYFKSGIEVEV